MCMNAKRFVLACISAVCATTAVYAQDKGHTVSANDYLNANKSTDATVLFNTSSEGVKTPVLWGLDTAWPDEANILRGINFIGKSQLGVGCGWGKCDCSRT